MTLDLAGEHAPSLPEPASFGASAGRRRSTPRAHVVAIVLARDGAARLPRVLAALDASTRPPHTVVGVDLGSRDESATLLASAGPVLTLPRKATPYDAVQAALASETARPPGHADAGEHTRPPGVVEWIWLLPQDAAPAPEALEQLLLGVENAPSVGIAGCKQVAWDDDSILLDVGFTASPSGLRVTGLDRGEVDQGQHDGRSDVLAVSGAGMLVRRDVWEQLGGLDPDLDDRATPVAADLDLCRRAHLAGHRVVVVPTAVVARATPAPSRRAARRAALHLRLAAAPLLLVPLAVAGVLAGAALHACGLLAAGRVAAARDEIAATLAAVSRPLGWRRTRRRQLRARQVPAQVLRRLGPPPDLVWRQRYDAFRSWLTPPGVAGHGTRTSRWRGVLVPVLLTAVAAGVTARSVLTGRTPASGIGLGRGPGSGLLPAPATSGLLWDAATSSWRDVGLGVRAAGDPYPALLALLGIPFGGNPDRAATVLLVGGLPLAALTAWIAASALTTSRALRTWAALGWAFAPPLLVAVGAGRTPAVLAHVLLPAAALAFARAVGMPPSASTQREGRRQFAAAARLGLLLTALLAAAPSLALPAAAVLAGGVVAGRRRALAPLTLAALVPVLLLLPWWAAVAHSPRLLLADPALSAAVDGSAPGPAGLARLLQTPVPPGLPPGTPLALSLAVLVPALVGGVLGVLRRRAGGRAVLGWWAGGAGVAGAAAACGLAVAGSRARPLAGLPGPALSLALVGLGAAALLGADVVPRTARRLRHARVARTLLVAGAAVAMAGALGAGTAAAWAGTTTGAAVLPLPAVARAEATSPAAPRALVLRVERSPSRVHWALVGADGPTLGDPSAALAVGGPESVASPPAGAGDDALVRPILARLLSDSGTDSRAALADLAVGSVVLLPPADPATVLALDGAPGLDRFGDARGSLLWRVQPPQGSALDRSARARVVDATGRTLAALPWMASGAVETWVRAGGRDRLVVLAQRYDAGWHATLDGAELTPVRWHGWAQAFALPSTGGRLDVGRDEGRVRLADPARAGVLVVALLAALPLPSVRGRGQAAPPPRPSRPLPRPVPAPDDLVPAPPPQVFDDEHPEDGTRPLRIGPLPRRPRRRFRLRRLLARRRPRREVP